MAVTVEDLLQLALPSGTRVAAGRAGLRREVVWARTLRPRPPAFEALEGGELALVSDAHLGMLEESMTLAYVLTRLAEVQVAAVAVLGGVDEAACDAGERLAIPLLKLPPDASLLEVERACVATIVDKRAELQRRGTEIYRELAQLTFEERGLQAVVNRLAEICGKAVAIEDDQFRLQFSSGGLGQLPTEDLSPLASRAEIEQWIRTVPLSSTQPPVGRFPLPEAALVRFVAAIPAREGVAGYLSVIGSDAELTEMDRLAAGRGAAVCAVEVAKEAAVGEAEARVRGDLLDQLLSEGLEGDQAALGKARRLGYDPSLPSLVMAFRVSNGERGGKATPVRSTDRLKGHLESLVRVEMARREPKSLVASRGVTVVAVVPLIRPSADGRLKEMAEEIRRRAQSALVDCRVAAGIGRPTSSGSSLATAFREAEGALGIGMRLHGPSSTTYFGDLGIMRLLAQVGSQSELESFRTEMLGRLEEHDRKGGGELLKTLEALFFCNGNLTRTAEHLSLHRNSLLYRLQRIAQISGHDLEDAETRLSLQVALRARQMLEAGRRPEG